MQRAAVADVEPETPGEVVRRTLTGTLGTTHVAVNHYRLPPGEGLPGGLHAHADQEEVFVVAAGVATFETWTPGRRTDEGAAGEGDEVTVRAGEAVRFAPGEFQSGRNDGDADLVVLAMGAPPDSEDLRLPVACPDCGHGEVRLDASGGEATFGCPACGVDHVPGACPECGHADLHVALRDGEPRAVCRGCGAEFEEPPCRG